MFQHKKCFSISSENQHPFQAAKSTIDKDVQEEITFFFDISNPVSNFSDSSFVNVIGA